MPSQGTPAACGCCVFLVVFLLCMSFSSLEYTQLGLNYSFFRSSVEGRGYTAGRYLLGLGHSFIKFPSTVQSIQFSNDYDSAGPPLRSRTSDGLEVQLEVSFQYQFNQTSIYDVYNKFGDGYMPIYVNMAMDIITTETTLYAATTFFTNRSIIAASMERKLRPQFENFGFCTLPFFQLRSVGLPSDFEAAISQTEMSKQDIQTAHAEKENREVEMLTQVLQAQQQGIQIELAANATAQQTLLLVDAYVNQFNLTQGLEADSFRHVLDKLDNDPDLFMEYLNMRALRDHPDHKTVVSLPNSFPRTGSPGAEL